LFIVTAVRAPSSWSMSTIKNKYRFIVQLGSLWIVSVDTEISLFNMIMLALAIKARLNRPWNVISCEHPSEGEVPRLFSICVPNQI
jgi:hypothetical protein